MTDGRPIWSYGVMTVSERLNVVLPGTLGSLSRAGFNDPHLFVDNGDGPLCRYQRFWLGLTIRSTRVRTYGNWVLSMWELYVRNPNADRFALFQDDLTTYKNLREYLDRCKFPRLGYWNLYTFPSNQQLAPEGRQGWYESNQLGRGAVALVFSRVGVTTLLGQQYLITMPQNREKGHRAVDGAILHSMKNAGWKEYVHNPSLVQHVGEDSSMGDKKHPQAESFKGEEFDALDLL